MLKENQLNTSPIGNIISSNSEHQLSQNSFPLRAREGFRCKREGFPELDTTPFDHQGWQRRLSFFTELNSDLNRNVKIPITSTVMNHREFVDLGLRALKNILELGENLGVRPTFYQVLARCSHDPHIGEVGTFAFEKLVRLMHTNYFRAGKFGDALWSGSEKNLFDSVTIAVTEGVHQNKTILQGILDIFKSQPHHLISSAEVSKLLSLDFDRLNASRLTAPAFQLLAEAGKIVRHPDHSDFSNKGVMCSVWSLASNSWEKPEVLNPEQAVLTHAAHNGGDWMHKLYANTNGENGVFCHHTVLKAARRLEDRGMVNLEERSEGSRFYKWVRLTDAAKPFVLPWDNVPVGGRLTSLNYDPLRSLLVKREAITAQRSDDTEQ